MTQISWFLEFLVDPWSASRSVTVMSPVKTAERIEMPI